MSSFFKTLRVGPCATNCYVFLAGSNVAVVDPGGLDPSIASTIESLGRAGHCLGAPVRILLTHTHADHFLGADALLERFPESTVYVSSKDAPGLFDPMLNVSGLFGLQLRLNGREAVKTVEDGEIIELGPYKIEVAATPGHTVGGVVFILREEKTVFSGDTLFRGNVGRTDLPGGDERVLFRSIREKLLVLPGDFNVYPGHGPGTTIRQEQGLLG
jgi:glyoxylase-like metal-dependent hydrolase (beta-lactamase superfamily II)